MRKLGYADWFETASYAHGTPTSVVLVQHEPWAGYALGDVIQRLNIMPYGMRVWVRLVYRGSCSTPQNEAELADARAFLYHILRPEVFPQFAPDRIYGWLICNEPNLEGPASALWAARAANGLAETLQHHGHRVATPPVAPWAPRGCNNAWAPNAEHPSRTESHPAEDYLFRMLCRLEMVRFDFAALHTYGWADAYYLNDMEPYVDARDSHGCPFGTRVALSQVAIFKHYWSVFGGVVPIIIDEWNTGARGVKYKKLPSHNYARGWVGNALEVIESGIGDFGGLRLDTMLWFPGRNPGAGHEWYEWAAEHPQGRCRVMREEIDGLIQIGW